MKLLLLLGVLATGTIFFVPKQKNITGTWVLDAKEKKCEAAVLRIQMAEGYFTAKLDIPEQEVYDKPVALQVAKDSIKIWLDKGKTCFIKAVVTDSVFIGKSFIGDKSETVRFYRANN
jgi:hypothetical protein